MPELEFTANVDFGCSEEFFHWKLQDKNAYFFFFFLALSEGVQSKQTFWLCSRTKGHVQWESAAVVSLLVVKG